MQIPLHQKRNEPLDASTAAVRLDHWMNMMSLRRDNGGFRQPRAGRDARQRVRIPEPTVVERLARKAYGT